MNLKKKDDEGSEVSRTFCFSLYKFPSPLQPTTSTAVKEEPVDIKEEKPRVSDQSLLRDKGLRNALKEAVVGMYKDQKVRKERIRDVFFQRQTYPYRKSASRAMVRQR